MNEGESIRDHRLSRRRQARGGVRVMCHRGGLFLGADLGLCVLDLSATGARLVLSEPLEPGREVSVKLEGRANVRPVRGVADVAWCVAMADGAHCAGVRFHKHLAHRELSELSRDHSEAPGYGSAGQGPPASAAGTGAGTGEAGAPSAREQRRAERHPAERLVRCHVSTCEKEGPDFRALILDLSNTGVGLVSPQRLTPGTAVALRFTSDRAGREMLGRAAYGAELAGGGFLLGVQLLLPLTDAECRAILPPPAAAAHAVAVGRLPSDAPASPTVG